MANITFRFGTSHSKPEVGVATALDLQLGLDGAAPVIGLVGGLFSSIDMPIASISAATQMPQIGLGTSPVLSNKDIYPYYLRTTPPDTIQAKAFWAWMVKYHVPLAVCIYGMEPYGKGLFQAIEDEAQVAGDRRRSKREGAGRARGKLCSNRGRVASLCATAQQTTWNVTHPL